MSESPRQTSEVSSLRSWLGANLHSSEIVCAGRYPGARSDAEFPHGVSTLSDSMSTPADESPRHHIESEVTMESFVERVSQMADADLKRVRWALGINGVLSLALGVIILIWPDISLFALTILFGAFTLATGVVGFGAAISGPMKEGRGWLIVSSLLSIAVGIVVLVWPSISALALLYVIGAYAIALGIITIGGAFWLPLDAGDAALLVLWGLLAIVFGIVMFAKPGDGALVLLAVIAAFALVRGVSELVVAIGGKAILERDFKRTRTKRAEPQPTS